MNSDLKATLRERLGKNYTVFIESLQSKSVSELIAMAPEITAAHQLHEELLDACDADDVEFLLRFDDPLEVVRGYWESEITGYDHSGEMGHMLWEIRRCIQKTSLPRLRKINLPPLRAKKRTTRG